MLRRLAIILVTVILTSAFWIFYFGISRSSTEHAVTTAEATGGQVAIPAKPGAAQVVVTRDLEIGPAGLAIPLPGIKAKDLVDTFTAARAGGRRRHDAIDIMAPEGTPVFAAAPGTVEKLFFSYGGGGITAYVRSDDQQWMYYYAHLHNYAAGLAEGQHLGRGAPIGNVGHTGDASPSGPHLHFAINRMNPGERWWQGTPINPYPLLAGRKVSG